MRALPRIRSRVLLCGLAALALGCAGLRARARASTKLAGVGDAPIDDAHVPTAAVESNVSCVRIAYAPLPVLGPIAVHTCFLVERRWNADVTTDRFEVWQSPSGPGRHVIRTNGLRGAYQGVGGAEPWVAHTFLGDDARRIARVLERSLEDYPDRDNYRYWPGPNSNTYPAWVLRTAGVAYELHPRAIGKDYRGLVGAGLTTTGSGLQLETPLVGVRVGLDEGIELHPLGMTFGVDLLPPAIKTPLGRLGFDE